MLLMRHAPTAWNRAGLVMGQTDVPLDSDGWAQAEFAAGSLNIEDVDALFCSPLIRCVQTAKAFEQVLDLKMKVIPELEERAWGSFEGHPKTDRCHASKGSGVEALAQFRKRVLNAFREIGRQGRQPLVVTHSGVIRVAMFERMQSPVRRIPHLTPLAIFNDF